MENAGGSADFNSMPEGCVASVLSLTTPRDACRLSAVSSVFRSAADSNAVWRRFLPDDYDSIIARSNEPAFLRSLPPKDLYLRLCGVPTLIDQGTKRVWLDRWSGKKCIKLSSRSLSIVWGDTPRYWRWIPSSEPKSSFEEVAMLMNVCWLEIHGRMETELLSSGTRYGVYFVFKAVNAFGFEHQPVEMRVGVTGQTVAEKSVYLDMDVQRRRREEEQRQIVPRAFPRPFRWTGGRVTAPPRVVMIPAPPLPTAEHREEEEVEKGNGPKERKDGWWEIEMGELYVDEGEEESYKEAVMSLLEVKGGNWKGGIIVEGIEIRPY